MADDNGPPKPEDLPDYCLEVTDFLKPEAKSLISRTLATWLNDNCVSPTELVSLAGHQKRLELAGTTRRNGIDRVAGAQAKAVHGRGSDRMKELAELVDGLMGYTSKHEEWAEAHPIKPETVDEMVAAATKELQGIELEARINAAISLYLGGTNRWPEKVERILTLVEATKTAAAMKYVESLLGEILSNGEIMGSLLEHPDPEEKKLLDIIAIASGNEKLREDVPDLIPRLQKIVREKKLDVARRGLVDALARGLTGSRALTRAFEVTPGNAEARIGELRSVHHIFVAVNKSQAPLMDPKLSQAFEVRMTRVFTEEAMSDMLRGQTTAGQADMLGVFQANVVGVRSVSLVQTAVGRLFGDDRFIEKLQEIGGSAVERLGRLGKSAATVQASDMAKIQKTEVLQRLDDAQYAILKKENVLGKIHSGPQSNTAKGMSLLTLCRDAHFIPGRNLDAARKLTRHFLAQKDFLPGYLEGATGGAREKKMVQLKKMLKIAGVS
ncbi:hypothetical protein [Magnetospira sp. QH-2]|uniref:hypothetical protein n=1 Tax=Magnetospira sp. (strain QH-2) TaxID=1288970 RepID=UPI0003E80FD1|nr:hypothetical protein [Magnetospira sp. QH-2]CCQ75734.1 conserved protein of unknown function [Magnetospira sp. QH-2]